MIIVIPCHNEPDLNGTLNSLLACDPPGCSAEIIIVVNDSSGSEGSEVRCQNLRTIQEFQVWKQNVESSNLKFHLIEALDLPSKIAGVGLARKIGMDEALRRLVSIDYDGSIICLDADCRVSKGYLKAIDQEFAQSGAGIGEMSFEHRFEDESDPKLREGIINYELFLRYYVEGLRQAKFPNAIHTIGSCMLVKASTYAKHGGMNKRKAGEDFYFLHKIVPHEKFVTVKGGKVYPSCRTSDRVPFGTGKAQNDWLNQADNIYLTHDPRVFEELKTINDSVKSLFRLEYQEWLSQKPESVQAFFDKHEFKTKIESVKANSKTPDQFSKQFYIWFDGFMCMKFIHFLRDMFYANMPIEVATQMLTGVEYDSLEQALEQFKQLDSRQK